MKIAVMASLFTKRYVNVKRRHNEVFCFEHTFLQKCVVANVETRFNSCGNSTIFICGINQKQLKISKNMDLNSFFTIFGSTKFAVVRLLPYFC